MLISIQEAAARLGKSERQLRYMIQKKRLEARKVCGRWRIETDALPLSDGQQRAYERKDRHLRAAVQECLGHDREPRSRERRYSLEDLKAWKIGSEIFEETAAALGADHAAALSLREMLRRLALGCHRYEREAKADAYRAARDEASGAACELLLSGRSEASRLLAAIEQELMAALAGLLRRLDRKRRIG